MLTGQIFFPDALSQFIYERVEPYAARGAGRTTLNANDGIARRATSASFAYVKELGDRYIVAMIIGVDPAATSTAMDMRPRRPLAGAPPPGDFGTGEGVMSFPATETSVSLVPGEKGIR